MTGEYQAISFLTGWVTYMLLIIPAGAIAVVTYQATRKSLTDNQDTIDDAAKKIRNTVKAAIIAECIAGVIEAVKVFYV